MREFDVTEKVLSGCNDKADRALTEIMWAREMSQASPTKEHRSDDDHLPKPVVISLVHTNPFTDRY